MIKGGACTPLTMQNVSAHSKLIERVSLKAFLHTFLTIISNNSSFSSIVVILNCFYRIFKNIFLYLLVWSKAYFLKNMKCQLLFN